MSTFKITVFMFIAGRVWAADPGECATPEQITAKLKAEDQHSFASAERPIKENGFETSHGIIFTTSSDRSTGYVLEADKPTGERASKICIRNRLADVRLFDARKPGLPTEALLKASEADGLRRCAELEKSGKLDARTCAPFNTTIRKGEPNGERIMAQGFNVKKLADGSYSKDGTLTTVTGNVNGSIHDDDKDPVKHIVSGIFFTSLPDGATIINMTTIYAEYTPYGISLLGR